MDFGSPHTLSHVPTAQPQPSPLQAISSPHRHCRVHYPFITPLNTQPSAPRIFIGYLRAPTTLTECMDHLVEMRLHYPEGGSSEFRSNLGCKCEELGTRYTCITPEGGSSQSSGQIWAAIVWGFVGLFGLSSIQSASLIWIHSFHTPSNSGLNLEFGLWHHGFESSKAPRAWASTSSRILYEKTTSYP
ncbi:hypothetical protein T440DRAFT_8646 [Plenodomus tracheiphilus IPT5]|uniref:Uncharacterized protein n=1 Tax=Plenodomus tracheiphilus IPT5 TaxID=1408161 RepID=A0A6A7BMX7_9PLEO|nr:hypothetical protein T440DRAFT_8646 [Plenodomus tracheiphilus IPT5]